MGNGKLTGRARKGQGGSTWFLAATLLAAFSLCPAAGGADAGLPEEGPAIRGELGSPVRAEGPRESPGSAAAPRRAPAAAMQPYDFGDPTDLEQYMLELVNDARAHPLETAERLSLTNLNEGLPPGTISPDPKQPLAWSRFLIASARAHSQWMLDNDIFSHYEGANNEIDPGDRMEAAGYPFRPPWTWGENIAWQGSTGGADGPSFTLAEHEGLFRSPHHRENILEPDFEEIGIGIIRGFFTSEGTTYDAYMTTQNFASSSGTPGPFVTGVVYADLDGDGAYSPGEGIGGVEIRPERGEYYAVTADSGGFAIPFIRNTGETTFTIRFPGVPDPLTRTLFLGTENVKMDIEASSGIPVEFAVSSARVDEQGVFHCRLSGPFGRRVRVERSTDLLHWSKAKDLTLEGGAAEFSESASHAARFYRARLLD